MGDEKPFKEKIANKIEQQPIVKEVAKAPESKPAFTGLPIDDTAEDWMNDEMGTFDSEDEDEKPDEEKITNEIEQKPIVAEVPKAPESKPAFAGLPIEDTAEDWMNDGMGTNNSEDEDEKPSSDNDDPQENSMEYNVTLSEESKASLPETKCVFAGLPMDNAADNWMDDDFGTIDSEEDEEVNSFEIEKKRIANKIEEFEEKLSKPINDDWIKNEILDIQNEAQPVSRAPWP